ncbi:MAG: methionine aminopeptidase, type I [Chloroflexi bacterium OLB15]|nr:MAG: methionine aminopeptidase, type I [Chloroflexi bacterium OLB15]
MTVESEGDLKSLMRIGQIVGETVRIMAEALRPGITTKELDEIGAAYLKKHHARSAPILTYKYPGYTCISINDEAAHGVPGSRVVKAGDLVNIDVSAELDGYFADTGASFPVPPITPEAEFLCDCTQMALDAALDVVSDGQRMNVIGRAVESIASKAGLHIIRDLGGHGIGRGLHETPRNVPNYYTNRAKERLVDGMVMTIEPFLTYGSGRIFTAKDGWTLKTSDGQLAAQYEHTIVITKGKPILVTAV